MLPATSEFAGRHTCDSPEWYTPMPFVNAARLVMGGIDLDPASHIEANATIQAARIFTAEDDGLQQKWSGRVFLNPPGGLVNEFWRKLCEQFGDERIDQAIWIGYSLEQLQTLQLAEARGWPLDFPTCIMKQRIAFIENAEKKAARIVKLLREGEAPNATERKRKIAAAIRAGKEPPNSPSHSNYITYLGPYIRRFESAFRPFGRLVNC